ncbi:hypothetical protein JKF63_07815 [Porcisia hertigi]|uniref:Uncharacterized protein n=1 Tax=Porcisia hertigi TaxID=2761500 RepID=A0A836LMH6_9TRYP|nr:hypothetical protein JKF63_07815 [Porcisia hertigi]
MNVSTVEVQRARRRYKALLRERESLASSGSSDPVVEDEIRKLEERYSELKSSLLQPLPNNFPATLAPVAHSATSEEPAKPLSSSVAPSASLSSELHLTHSNPGPCAQSDELCVKALDTQHQPHTAPSRAGAHPPARPEGYLILFFLQLFNESRQPSLLGCWNCAVIATFSMAIALLHCILLDPSSTIGSILTPSRLCCLVHAKNLASLYRRANRPLCVPMLIVYVCCDVVPSFALNMVVYKVSLTLMGFYGVRPLSFAC